MSVEQWEALNRKINTETLNHVENKEKVTDMVMTDRVGPDPNKMETGKLGAL